MIATQDFIVMGLGEATAPEPELFEAKARATIRYADPAAWTIATAIGRATLEARRQAEFSPHQVGVILISDVGPFETMTVVGAAAAEGLPSPLRYPAAGPGSMVGVTCIAFGFRGPTLNLAMLPKLGIPVALQLCNAWLTRNIIRQMVVATLTSSGLSSRIARALLLTHEDGHAEDAGVHGQSLADWLCLKDPRNDENP